MMKETNIIHRMKIKHKATPWDGPPWGWGMGVMPSSKKNQIFFSKFYFLMNRENLQ